jgi:hypothetical protein
MNVSAPSCPLCGGPTVIYGRRVVSALTRVFATKTPKPDEIIYIFRGECGTQFAHTVTAERAAKEQVTTEEKRIDVASHSPPATIRGMEPNSYEAPHGPATPPAGVTCLRRLTPVQWVIAIVAVC